MVRNRAGPSLVGLTTRICARGAAPFAVSQDIRDIVCRSRSRLSLSALFVLPLLRPFFRSFTGACCRGIWAKVYLLTNGNPERLRSCLKLSSTSNSCRRPQLNLVAPPASAGNFQAYTFASTAPSPFTFDIPSNPLLFFFQQPAAAHIPWPALLSDI
jgi:hypothetical protein